MNTLEIKYFTTLEAADELGYTRQYISQLVRTGQLSGEHIGRDILVTRASVEKYKEKYNGQHRAPGRKPAKIVKVKRSPKSIKTAKLETALVSA